MTYLLDTHVWLWMLASPERIDDVALAAISDSASTLLLSAASSWELAIKTRLGKLTLPGPVGTFVPQAMQRSRVQPLAVTHGHALRVAELPAHHADPFDRLLVAQAQLELLTLVTADNAMEAYEVPLLRVNRSR